MKHELNSQNTKQMLCDAFITLASKKAFSKITVSEIINLCNVNRKTFYYHFTDVYDLLEWHLTNEIQAVISSFNPLSDINATITFSINYMSQHTYLQNFIEDPIAKSTITNLLNKTLYPKAVETIEELENMHKKKLESDFKEFLARNFTHMVVLSILDNIENPDNYDIEKMEKYLAMILNSSITSFFQQL